MFSIVQKKNSFIFYGFSFLPPTININRFGLKAPEVPIIISIQLSASKPFLIINLAVPEETVMFHGGGSEAKLLHESCNAITGGGGSEQVSRGKNLEFRADLNHEQAQGVMV